MSSVCAPTRSRSVSPLGTSRFEKPFTFIRRRRRPSLEQAATPTTKPDMAYTQNRSYQHHRDISISAWSGTSDASTSILFSTAPTSAQHSPVNTKPAVVTNDESWHADRYDNYEHRHEYHHDYKHDPYDHAATPSHKDDFDLNGPDEWYARLDGGEDSYGDECPDGATLAAVNDILLYTADGAAVPFGSLHNPSTALNQRQLIIFVRHFYCGACQAYVRAITEGITLRDYFTIPIPTSIIVIGCGSPELIPFYKAVTGTSFPVFAEPSRQLYKKLGMVLSGNLGSKRPEYMKDVSAPAWLAGQLVTMRNGLVARRQTRKLSRMTSGFDLLGNPTASSPRTSSSIDMRSMRTQDYDEQGERPSINTRINQLSERAKSVHTSISTLALRKRDLIHGGNLFQIGGEFLFEDGEVIWCHRMRHYRDHVEIPDIRRLLELDT